MIRLLQPAPNEYRHLLRTRSLDGCRVIPDALPEWVIVDQGLRGVTDHPLSYRYSIPFLILCTDRNTIVGNIGGKGWLPEEEEVELGYHMAAAFRGRGYMTAAIAAVQHLARQDRISLLAHLETDNEASRAVLRRNGFTREALVELPDSLLLERWSWSPD
ncbi:GNAT family N-acetyltransferase [Neolewinella litorea]|uniref:N-acetyltransferase n=1 Tax=Neolewinella litorea TaxID=2562452 RepID=A0A4S4NQY5_9BACT|nr:GNAT family N-acetyltransferase [Neolewinella litorea]THH41587.1 N-acetyltransferase [Neolewinella litorea]